MSNTNIEEVVTPEQTTEQAVVETPVEEVVVSAKDSGLDQTVSAVSSDSAIFDRQTVDFDVERERKRQKAAHITKNVVVYTFLTIAALLAFLPFYWMIISSFITEAKYRESTPTFFTTQFQFKNYGMVLGSADEADGFGQMIINTLVVGFVSTALGVAVTILTAYALARMNFKGKNLLFTLMLGTMMIPGEMYTITNYITVSPSKLNWVDSFTVMIVPFLVSVYYIYLLRNNFMQIPNSLYQAAKVDGLSDMGYLIKVMIPLTAPTLVSITLLKFIGTWNSYIWPNLVNNTNWQMITNWVSRSFTDKGYSLWGEALYPMVSLDGTVDVTKSIYGSNTLTTLKMAAVCMVSLPLFILFIFCRKYIMRGVSKSGTKG